MFARVTALVTFEGFLSCVVARVYSQTVRPSTGVVTLVTVERFFSCVFAFVYFQITTLSARIVALATDERLFYSVLILPYMVVVWKITCGHIQEKSLLCVINVLIPVLSLKI